MSTYFDAVVEWSPTEAVLYTAPGVPGTVIRDFSGLGGKRVLIALSRRSSFVRTARVPNVGKDEIRQILSLSTGEMLPLPASELAYDFLVTNDVDVNGKLVVLGAVRVTDLQNLKQALAVAGVKGAVVVPAAFGGALVATGAGSANSAVVSRCLGGFAIDLVEKGHISSTRVVDEASTPDNLAQEVNRSYAASELEAAPILSSGNLNILEASNHVGATPIDKLFDFKVETNGFNLQLPEERAKQAGEKERKIRTLAGFSCGVALALCALSYSMYLTKSEAERKTKALAGKQLRDAKRVQSLEESQSQEARSKLEVLERSFKPAQKLGDVITVASNLLPEKVWLTGFMVDRGRTLQIRGYAQSTEALAQYEKALADEPRFRDVQLVTANNAQINKEPVVQFTLTAFPVGNLPLVEADKVASTGFAGGVR